MPVIRSVIQSAVRGTPGQLIRKRLGAGLFISDGRDTARIRRNFRTSLRLSATEAVRFYRKQLIHDVGVTTTKRTGNLRRVRVRRRTRSTQIALVEDFPRTSFGTGQYAYVVNAPGRAEGGKGRGGNRKFISHARGATNAALQSIFARGIARANARRL